MRIIGFEVVVDGGKKRREDMGVRACMCRCVCVGKGFVFEFI